MNKALRPLIDEAAPNGRAPILDEQVNHLIRQVHQRASGIVAAALGENFTPTQFSALARLEERVTLSQNHLGRLTAMDPATIQGVVRRLAERGLVERASDPADRRRTVLWLTAEGKATVARLAAAVAEANDRILAPLSPGERQQLLSLLNRLT